MKWPWSKQTEKSGQQGHMTLADVHDYIGSRYGVSPVKAFDEDPGIGVFARPDNGKWFVATKNIRCSSVGAAGDGLLTTDGNWEGGAAPDLTEGTAKLFFSAGTASATVSGTAYVYGITFCTNAAFTLTGADANAKVVVGAGGFLFTNTAAASVTHVLDVPVEIGTLPQTWRVASTNTQLSLTAPLTGRAALAPLTIDCRGRVQFRADNSGLLTPLVLTNVTTATQPYVYDMKGLGAPSRFTTVPRWSRTRGSVAAATRRRLPPTGVTRVIRKYLPMRRICISSGRHGKPWARGLSSSSSRRNGLSFPRTSSLSPMPSSCPSA